MPKTPLSTLSADGVLHLSCPRSWDEMTQEQLRIALHYIGSGLHSPVEYKILILIAFTGLRTGGQTPYGWTCTIPVTDAKGKQRTHSFLLQPWQLQSMINQLEYVDSYDTFNVRLESIGDAEAVDALLHGVRFIGYLNMEKYYQGYISTQNPKYIHGLARLLYPGYEPQRGDYIERTNCIMWYSYVKKQFSKYFRHFFRPAPIVHGKPVNWLDQMNAQIRALTDGDITKEQAVFDKDCWRALTELDAKAREAEEFRKKYGKS